MLSVAGRRDNAAILEMRDDYCFLTHVYVMTQLLILSYVYK